MKYLPIIFALFLIGCETTKPFTITKNHYVALTITGEFKPVDKCPYPQKSDHIFDGTDLEGSDWILAAYSAWLCEHETRMAIVKENEQQALDVAKRNTK